MKINFSKLFRENKYPVYINILERFFFFLIFLVIAREYSADSFGELITIFSLANIFAIIFDLGIPLFLQKEFSSREKHSADLAVNAIAVSVFLFPVYFLTLTLYQLLIFPEFPFRLFTFTSILVYLFSVSNLISKALSGLRDFQSQFKALLFSRTFAFTFFIVFAVILKTDLSILIIILTAGAVIQLHSLIRSLRSNKINLSLKNFSLKTSKSILKISLPLGLAVLFNFLYDKIDIILISKIIDFENTAYYSIGYGIFKSSALIYSFLFITGLNRISYLSRNKRAVELFYKKYLSLLMPVCIILTAVLFFFAGVIIELFYTDKFNDSVLVLKILSFAVTGLALNNLTGVILNGLGMYRQNMNVTFLGLILNIILNIIFLPVYGIAGAAVITVLTEYFIFTGDYIYLKKFKAI
ncbi:MAG TPA: oligosaccharide flippase family protein [Ignavibacteria bacterium]|nr:oligosaccharide flippase family protein [Ignavibacteria bacterium]HRJ98443.1 oligosaccharide flippase family protein [Ignavibacteria bacterium]